MVLHLLRSSFSVLFFFQGLFLLLSQKKNICNRSKRSSNGREKPGRPVCVSILWNPSPQAVGSLSSHPQLIFEEKSLLLSPRPVCHLFPSVSVATADTGSHLCSVLFCFLLSDLSLSVTKEIS